MPNNLKDVGVGVHTVHRVDLNKTYIRLAIGGQHVDLTIAQANIVEYILRHAIEQATNTKQVSPYLLDETVSEEGVK